MDPQVGLCFIYSRMKNICHPVFQTTKQNIVDNLWPMKK